MIQRTVERMYSEIEENRFLEVTYANGDKEVLYFKDFNSGAMIQNIVDRAKKMAIKDFLEHRPEGHAHLPPARRVRRRVQGERGPAQHHQPRRLGADLRQEGRAHRLHPHAHPGQAGHRGRPRPSTPSPTPASTSEPTSRQTGVPAPVPAGAPGWPSTSRSTSCGRPGRTASPGRRGGARSSSTVSQPPHAISAAWWVIGPSYVVVNDVAELPGDLVGVPTDVPSGFKRDVPGRRAPRLELARRRRLRQSSPAGHAARRPSSRACPGKTSLVLGAPVHVDPAGRVPAPARRPPACGRLSRRITDRGADPTSPCPSRRRSRPAPRPIRRHPAPSSRSAHRTT